MVGEGGKKHPPAGEEASLVADFPTTATLFGAGVGNTLQERARLKRSFGGWWGRVADRRLIRYWRASLFMMHTRHPNVHTHKNVFACGTRERQNDRTTLMKTRGTNKTVPQKDVSSCSGAPRLVQAVARLPAVGALSQKLRSAELHFPDVTLKQWQVTHEQCGGLRVVATDVRIALVHVRAGKRLISSRR